MKEFCKSLIEPRSYEPDMRNRELVLNYILLGLIFLVAIEFINSLIGFALIQLNYSVFRLFSFAAILSLFCSSYWLVRRYQLTKTVGFLITFTLLFLSSLIVRNWGILTPTGILLFGLVIVMSGILLGSRYALYSALATVLILATLEYLKAQGLVKPNLTWMQRPSSMSDIMGFSVIYAVMALVLWLYNQQMERSLARAQASEAALSRQKDLLEETVKERTRQLEVAQLERLQQVYRFAELGRISSALFHDLANHLTAVSLDIEGLGNQQKSTLLNRVQHDINYVDDVVQRVRLQLRGQGSIERFEVTREIKKVAKILNYKMVQSGLRFELHTPRQPLYFKGDVIPFRQIISNLISNAIDASEVANKHHKPIIRVTVSSDKKSILIVVTDWGVGIKPARLDKIFEPFYSSKTDGTGIGLFIVKQIVENDLHGSLTVVSSPQTGTSFSVSIPHSHAKR